MRPAARFKRGGSFCVGFVDTISFHLKARNFAGAFPQNGSFPGPKDEQQFFAQTE
jgi:hypothetical protein